MGLLRLAAAVLVALTAVMLPVSADPVPEATAKAMLLHNLATYTAWPHDRDGRTELVIGVVGPDAVLKPLGELHGARVNGRVLVVREIRAQDDPRGCDILFVPGTHQRSYTLFQSLAGAPVLTVSDGAQALGEGAAVRVFFERSRLRLEIELTAMERSGVRISSKVLNLSRVLRNGHVVAPGFRP